MLKYPCLVLDHDDTLIMSESALNYPSFLVALEIMRPGMTITREDYTRWCFHPGFLQLCTEQFGFTPEELQQEYGIWQDYIKDRYAPLFDGMERLVRRFVDAGGILCVVSHSSDKTIARDYERYFGFQPHMVFGWDHPAEHRKPNPWPLQQIMEKYGFTPEQLLMVDDLRPGCDMAHAAGVKCAFAGWGRTNVPEIGEFMRAHCDFSFDSPAQLEEFLF